MGIQFMGFVPNIQTSVNWNKTECVWLNKEQAVVARTCHPEKPWQMLCIWLLITVDLCDNSNNQTGSWKDEKIPRLSSQVWKQVVSTILTLANTQRDVEWEYKGPEVMKNILHAAFRWKITYGSMVVGEMGPLTWPVTTHMSSSQGLDWGRDINLLVLAWTDQCWWIPFTKKKLNT